MHATPFLADLAIVLGVAAVTSVLARLLKQPTILGYLLAGLIVGPYLPVPLFANPERVHHMAEFGVILVMFAIGLEFRIARLMKVLPVAGLTGLVQIGLLTWAGFTVGQLLGWGTVEALFLGTGVAISSTMVVSKVFEARPVAADVRELVLGVLVIQDVVAIVMIAAMTGVAAGGGLSPGELAKTLGGLGAVLLGMIVVGLLLVPRLIRAVKGLASPEILVVVSVGLCFGVALLADLMGYSVALGAFIAGILVAESGEGVAIEHAIQPVRDMFAAVFFVSIGMTVDPVQAWSSLPTALLIFVLVVLAQLFSVSAAGVLAGNGLRRSVTAGLALGQIGEFGFILASIGISAGVARPELQSILVTVAILTAFTTPQMLALAPRVVRLADHLLPRRVQHLIGLYEAWLERLRSQRKDGRRTSLMRAVRVIALDTLGLLVLVSLTISGMPLVTRWAEAELGLEPAVAGLGIGGVAVAISVPLLAGLIRNAAALGRLVAESVLPTREDDAEIGPAERVVTHVLKGMVYLGVVAGVGFPTIAVLRPVIGYAVGIVLLVAALVAVGLYLWRGAGRFADELASGSNQIAQMLARQAAADADDPEPPPAVLPGLARPEVFAVTGAAPCAGRTLADLDLRARTGADIVAIHRAGTPLILPTGHERLEDGDLVAVTGSADALALARALLSAPAHGGPAPGPG